MQVHSNKRSICLDLKTDEGIQVFNRMASDADILVESFRGGVMEGLRLAYDQLKRLNSALVYCKISGFGATGPYRQRGGFDLVAQGMTGLMSITGHPGGPPARHVITWPHPIRPLPAPKAT